MLFDVDALLQENQAQTSQEFLSDRTKTILRFMLAELGLDKEWAAGLLGMAKADTNHVCYMAGPAIVHRSCWMSIVPPWVFQAIWIDRLDQIFAEITTGNIGDLATPSEIVAYMMPATYEAPLGHRWTDVYLWASREALVKHNRMRDGQDPWEIIGGSPVRYDSIKFDYERIARDIRSDVIKAAKTRGWGSVRRQMKELEIRGDESESELDGLVEQTDLFSLAPGEDAAEENHTVPPPIQQTNLFDF